MEEVRFVGAVGAVVSPLLALRVTEIVDVVALFWASYARAWIECVPLGKLKNVNEYGGKYTFFISVPSRENATRATPKLSEAVAETVTKSSVVTIVLFAGLVMETVGLVLQT